MLKLNRRQSEHGLVSNCFSGESVATCLILMGSIQSTTHGPDTALPLRWPRASSACLEAERYRTKRRS